MKYTIIAATALAILVAGCTPVITHAPIKSTPEETVTCAGDVLGSMGYRLLDRELYLRAERAKHVAFGHHTADYDRITIAVSNERLSVRGETVSIGGGPSRPLGAYPHAGALIAIPPSKELRADVARITAQCGGGV